jgi:filamentous hemagglutinin family protein
MSYSDPFRKRYSRLAMPARLGVAAVAACFLSAPVLSNPLNPTVVNGLASFNQAGKVLTVTNTPGAIINWQKFSIQAGETTHFAQTAASSSVLNRVLNDPTAIYGTLSSNGRVWLVNPAGIMVGPGGKVDVAAFVASTLNISNADFLAGRHVFINDGNAKNVINQGEIRTPAGGSVYLIGSNVTNEGIITTPKGETILAAGNTVSLIDSATPGVKVDITGSEGNATNLGTLTAEAGRIGVAGVIVRNSGTVNASSVVSEGGRVFLKASQDAYVDGNGRIVTTGTKGGNVEVLGNRVSVMDKAEIDASGTGDTNASGGRILVGGDYQGNNPDIQNASVSYFGPNATLKADAGKVGDGGTVIVWADDTTRAYGNISARGGALGGNGGFVETSGKNYLAVDGIRVDTAGGNWLLDPSDFNIAATGGDISGATLSSNLASNNITILSSGGASGSNGDVFVNDNVVWSSGFGLTLSAYRNINVNSVISASGNLASLALTPNTGLGGGSYSIGGGGRIDLGGSSPGLTISGQGYTVINSLGVFGDTSTTTLQGMKNGLANRYALGSNIDASATSGWDGGNGFLPVGNATTNFTGVFDGLGHTIFGLTVNRPATANVGLFGYANGATIRNVGLNAATIVGSSFVGSLAGRMDGSVSHISNSHSTSATITGGAGFVGGLAGWIRGDISYSYSSGSATGTGATGGLSGGNQAGQSNISNSYSSMTVSGAGAGGLVGGNDGNISKSYSTGTVTGTSQAGGLVGQNHAGNISDSYSTGNVIGSGGTTAGGLVGYNGPSFSGGTTITNSYSTGQVSGVVVGGLVGSNAGTVTGSFWDTQTSGQATSAGGVGLLTSQAMQSTSYIGWDLANTWYMVDGNTRPFLRMEYSTTITNAHQLQLMAMNQSANYSLANNISMAELANPSGLWDTASGFVPVSYFVGLLEGNGHTIAGLAINRPGSDFVGMFGEIGDSGVVRNLGLVNVNVVARTYVGGLVGELYGTGRIDNSYVTGTVSGGGQFIGGMAGLNFGGSIANSYSAGTVSGSGADVDPVLNFGRRRIHIGGLVGENYGSGSDGVVSNSYSSAVVNANGDIAGGLVGYIFGGIVSNSHSTGAVTAIVGGDSGNAAGGLVGSNDASGRIENSWSSGAVSGANEVGGLVGGNRYGSIVNSWSTGAVLGNWSVGGLVGENRTLGTSIGGSVSNSYTTGTASGVNYVGGLVGQNGGSIGSSYATGAVSGSAFIGGLAGYDSGTISDSYATGAATGSSSYAGGLVGYAGAGTISNSYSTGVVSGVTDYGGLVGKNTGATIANSFWDTETSGQATSAGGSGRTTAQMQTAATFIDAGWPPAVWTLIDGAYPVLGGSTLPVPQPTQPTLDETIDPCTLSPDVCSPPSPIANPMIDNPVIDFVEGDPCVASPDSAECKAFKPSEESNEEGEFGDEDRDRNRKSARGQVTQCGI